MIKIKLFTVFYNFCSAILLIYVDYTGNIDQNWDAQLVRSIKEFAYYILDQIFD